MSIARNQCMSIARNQCMSIAIKYLFCLAVTPLRRQSLVMPEAMPDTRRVRNLIVYGHVNKCPRSNVVTG